ncbi:hypothetical protein BGZ92_007912 [Podila epicladia]|nr:hypothetical protein BGZ92_007912 [Podila epicladia]
MRKWRIPIEVLQAQSQHFRYVRLQLPLPWVDSLQLTQLHTLDITTPVLLQNMHLLHANTQLSKLTLRFRDKVAYKDIQPALESLTRLTFLQLSGLKLDNSDDLGGFLNNNPGLQELELIYVSGIARFQGFPQLHLTRIWLELFWSDNLGLVQLFRLCPSLESLSMFAVDAPSELQNALRSHCPKLKSIGCMDDPDLQPDPLTEAEAVSWIKLPSQLAVFNASLQVFTGKVYQAIVDQAASLESIKLDFRECSKDNALYARKLLGLCPKLKHLHITHYQDDDLPRRLDSSLEWFNALQKHPTLNSIKIWGFVLDWQPGNNDGSYEDGWEDSDLDDNDSEVEFDQEDEDSEPDQGQSQSQSDGDSEDGTDQGEGDSEDGLDLEVSETGGGSNPGKAEPEQENKLLDQDDLPNGNQHGTAEQQVYAIVEKPKIPRSHPAEDQEFIDTITSQGWTYEEDHDLRNRVHPYYLISKGARFIRNQIFQGLEGSPNLSKITVGGFVYVNKNRKPVVERYP